MRKVFIFLATLIFVVAVACEGEIVIPTTTVPPIAEAPTLGESTETLSGDCEVFFTNPAGDLVDNRSPEEGLIELINSADQTIDMAVFEFDLVSAKDALFDAWNRGVEIRVVYDDQYSGEDTDMAELLSLGITGVPDERSALMHNKFLIVDRTTVWTGSFNLTENAAHKNNENAMRIESPELARFYTEEFEKMFAGDFGPHKSDDYYPPVTICGGANARVYFLPDGPKAAILPVLTSADEYIHVMAFSFTDDEMGEILVAKNQAGLDVGAIFESTGSGTQYSEFGHLIDNSDEDCKDANSATFHHKVIVVDGETVIFGSYNFSASAENDNDENMLVVESPAVVQEFEEEYQRRLVESEAEGLCILE